MSGFVIESLYLTGWRRGSQVYWRYVDAVREAQTQLSEDESRAVRILPIKVADDPVFEWEKLEVAS